MEDSDPLVPSFKIQLLENPPTFDKLKRWNNSLKAITHKLSFSIWIWFSSPVQTDATVLANNSHFDSEDDYHTGCRNVSHCQQQQSYSGLRSPGWSNSTYFWTPNIVRFYVLRPFAHPVACCWMLLEVVAQSLKPVKLFSSAPCKRTQQLLTLRCPFARSCMSSAPGPSCSKSDSAIHWINLCPMDSVIGFPNTYPLDCDLSNG